MKRLFFYLIVMSTAISCYYDVEEDFSKQIECDSEGVSYSQDIVRIVSGRCYKCHAVALNLGNITLEGYDKIKIHVSNGRLLGAIKRESGFSPMPQNESQLPACDIMMIESWINLGAPNN